jgi:hypothetical protein
MVMGERLCYCGRDYRPTGLQGHTSAIRGDVSRFRASLGSSTC